MSRRIKEYILSKRFYNRLKNSYGKLTCYTCRCELKMGDEIVSVATQYGDRVLRHRSCAERINLI